MTSLLLASASPARAATLRAAGIEPTIVVSDVDEPAALAEARKNGPLNVAESVQVLAEAKARAVAAEHPGRADITLGCDSLLELDGEGLGKPESARVARERWRRMRGRTGTLHPALRDHLRRAGAGASTEVSFADISDGVDAYVATGEPLKVAERSPSTPRRSVHHANPRGSPRRRGAELARIADHARRPRVLLALPVGAVSGKFVQCS